MGSFLPVELIDYSRNEWRNLSAFTVWSLNSYFRLILVLFLGKLLAFIVWNIYRLFKKWVTKSFCWLIFRTFTVSLRIRTEGPNSCSRQIVGGSFLVLYCLGLLLPFQLWPNQVLHVVCLIFFLEVDFYKTGCWSLEGSPILFLTSFWWLLYR